MRTLSYDAGAAPIDCLYTVLEALGSVTADTLMMRHVPEPMGYIAEMPEIVRMEGGEQAIEIRFSGELTRAQWVDFEKLVDNSFARSAQG